MFEGGLKKHKHHESNFELQITALVDTLVIILIFLLKSIATETLDIEQPKNLHLPGVTDGVFTGKGDQLVLRTDGISWNNIAIQGDDITLWKSLESAIAATAAEKIKSDFEGKLLVQADKTISFTQLSRALHIAKAHGYHDIRFVGVRYN